MSLKRDKKIWLVTNPDAGIMLENSKKLEEHLRKKKMERKILRTPSGVTIIESNKPEVISDYMKFFSAQSPNTK